mgnify:CR=1 FL=1
MKKALIVSPYLDHLGGGERYMLSVASVLENLGHEIYFAWDNLTEITTLAGMFGLTLNNPKLAPSIKSLYITHHPLSMYLATRPYDVVVYLSDGSIPLLGGKRNILHLQVPFHGVRGRSWKNALKKQFIHSIIVNSRFTKTIVDAEYGINSTVIYPPVSSIHPSTKSKTILSVGRFEPSLNTKHQDILMQAFRELSPQLPDWKLVLAGASSNEDWVTHLRTLATGLPIDILTNVSYAEICQLYAESWIYWHAAGYGVDEIKNPELTEHFGISTVEAISAGCIPLVVPSGGQKEIVTNPSLHWTTPSELIVKTLDIISAPPPSTLDISLYSIEKFSDQLKKII